ncbi:helix-turn-helix domain-containing protein [Quadrisphaera sp. DSM 44207]|uniref:helix-turn-helix domain-containing protein n=1 Tax=Quadrisphaera sp. DSM 44207 TaxID=1881057 RepID=UPI000891939F|nr:helix-turn-helix domain-containing protein [Quadrisphaera sp. DSM 44207]SDQ21516.1 Helix-turn-helix domain-containing protein [Quadrisphaera sp. DSM 44207]
MDDRAEVRDFLTTRRAEIGPQQAGLPDVGARRVPGLRRSEVAALAGISVEHYAKLERGALAGASPSVLDALQWALDTVTAGPVVVRNGRMDLLATNALGRVMHSSLYDAHPTGPPNFARYTFLDADARRFYPDWERAADTAVAILRTEAGRDPHDKGPHDLVGELSTRSEEFRRRWSSHDVRLHGAGAKTFSHRVVGDLELAYESMDVVSEPGLSLTLYAAEPASPTAERLALLASWTATREPATTSG